MILEGDYIYPAHIQRQQYLPISSALILLPRKSIRQGLYLLGEHFPDREALLVVGLTGSTRWQAREIELQMSVH